MWFTLNFIVAFLIATVVASPTASAFQNIYCAFGAILPTPTYGLKDAVFTVCGTSVVSGSVQQVSNAILDFRSYYKWNTFITNASLSVCTPDCVYAPGLSIAFTSTGIVPDLTTVGTDVTTYIERPYFFAWKNTGTPAETGVSEHVSVFVPLPGGKVRYTHWQTQYGAGAKNLLPVKDAFQSQFQKQADELKVYVEGS
jgi:hypothetical protein